MQGDQKVDELMRPVHAAIKRHVKDGTAVTEIYNRAYEAVTISMDAKDGEIKALRARAERAEAALALCQHVLKTTRKFLSQFWVDDPVLKHEYHVIDELICEAVRGGEA